MDDQQLTERQRRALEFRDRARSAGVKLSAYARSQGVAVREIYDALAALRRRRAVAAAKRHPAASDFVAVRVTTDPGTGAPVCRVQWRGVQIECTQWPPAAWLVELERTDAAP